MNTYLKRVLSLFLIILLVFASVSMTAYAAKGKEKPKSVKIEGSNYVAAGKKIKLKAVVVPEDASPKVTWVSDDPSVATVDSKGNVKGIHPGKTKITVTTDAKPHKKASFSIQVMRDPVKKVKISGASDIEVGQTLTLKATCSPKTAAKTVDWKSSDPNVATVTTKGIITAVSAGSVIITATATDGSKKKAKVEIKVTEPEPEPEPTPAPTPLIVQFDLALKQEASYIYVSWPMQTNTAIYEMDRKAGTDAWVRIASTVATEYTDTNVEYNVEYSYRVRAYNAAGECIAESSETGNSIIMKPENKITGDIQSLYGKSINDANALLEDQLILDPDQHYPNTYSNGYFVVSLSDVSGMIDHIAIVNGTKYTLHGLNLGMAWGDAKAKLEAEGWMVIMDYEDLNNYLVYGNNQYPYEVVIEKNADSTTVNIYLGFGGNG